MAVIDLENMKKYLNGLHKALASLHKNEPVEEVVFAKLYTNEDGLTLLLNAELDDFADSGIDIGVVEDEKNLETKVGVTVYDEETYNNALSAITVVACKIGLVYDEEFVTEELDPKDYLSNDINDNVKVLVYTPAIKTIKVKVIKMKETVVRRMVPLTFTQKLVMKGANPKDMEYREKIRKHFDSLLNKFMTKKVKYRLTKKCVKVTYKRDTLCKMVIAGKKVVKVYLALNPYAYEADYNITDCSDKNSYKDVPACLKVTGRVSLNRAYALIDEVLNHYDIPENKKYVPNYPYSKEIISEYLKEQKAKQAEQVANLEKTEAPAIAK